MHYALGVCFVCGVKAEIFLFALANHFTEAIAFNIISIYFALFSESKRLMSYAPGLRLTRFPQDVFCGYVLHAKWHISVPLT